MDVSKIDPETLMSLYSIVFQDVTLFDNTVMENIRIGKKDASDEEVMAAARLANVAEFVEKLPDKWNSNIGENGCELSGGERQRIAIARAMLKKASVIILDEATAFADPESEAQIQQAISRLVRGKTLIVVAHRLNTIQNADQILVIDQGRLAACGRQEELLNTCPLYRTMWEQYQSTAAFAGKEVN